tara:strand:- start:131 stop:346 length:216 start_codon:yes stop_codon:yes gene_type:complete
MTSKIEIPNSVDETVRYTVEYSRMWNRYSVMEGTTSIIDTADRGTAYQIYRNKTGSRLSLKEFLGLIKIVV